MTPVQRRRALRYITEHLAVPPIPQPLLANEQPLASRESAAPQPGDPDSGSEGSASPPRTPRWDPPAQTVEKRPDGRIAPVRTVGRPKRERSLTVLTIVLLVALVTTAGFFLTTWAPRLRPTHLAILEPTPAATGARAAVISGDRTLLLVATGLPLPAPGFTYVAWNRTEDGWLRLGELRQVAPESFSMRLTGRRESVDEITIERTGQQDGRGPVMMEGLTSP